MKNQDTKITLKTLDKWTKIALDNDLDFIDEFCPSAWMIGGICWSGRVMKINYILSGGGHITDSAAMEKWLKWLDRKTKK